MPQPNEEAPLEEVRDELGELILAYLPPIANSEGYECRGTVAETLTEVVKEYIATLAEVVKDNITETVAANEVGKVQWQVRMPEDRNSDDGWQNNVEMGALYLEREHGAEVRTRVVTNWYVRGE